MSQPATALALRSEGQRMLLAVTGTLSAIAAELGIPDKSKAMVHHWRTGSKTPTKEYQARMWSAFGIPERAWALRPGGALDTAPDAPSTAPLAVSQSTAPAGNPSTLEDCLALLAVIRADRQQQGLMPSERVKLADAEARILGLRSRLEQAAEFAEARYVAEHPAWLRLRRAIVKALEAHPIAAKAVLEAIQQIEGGTK